MVWRNSLTLALSPTALQLMLTARLRIFPFRCGRRNVGAIRISADCTWFPMSQRRCIASARNQVGRRVSVWMNDKDPIHWYNSKASGEGWQLS
jgi:hypothetical protein